MHLFALALFANVVLLSLSYNFCFVVISCGWCSLLFLSRLLHVLVVGGKSSCNRPSGKASSICTSYFFQFVCSSFYWRADIPFKVDKIITAKSKRHGQEKKGRIFKWASSSKCMSESVLPNLEWLNNCTPMNTDKEYFTFCPLMDANTLLSMPLCLPKVTNVCLVGCFPIFEELSPFQFR